ncbi:MAG: hypothetical protein ABIG42_00980 [bacterium]
MRRFSFLIIFFVISCFTFSCGRDVNQTPADELKSRTQSNTQSPDAAQGKTKPKKDIQELNDLQDQLAQNPGDYSIAFPLIQRYESLEMIDEAITVMDNFIDISTDTAKDRARLDRALLHARYKNKSFAFDEFLDLAENGPEEYQAEAYFQLGNLLAVEKFDPPEGDRIELSVEYFTLASRLESGNALLYKRLADLMYSSGKLEEAREYLAIFLVVYPEDWQSLIELAKWSIEAGDVEKARKYLERALDSNNDEITKIAKKMLDDLNNA